ncbi:hypothetical protein [Streptomyces sp. NPDC056061]|uniref:hypothetical protein n=1 Tax=Streptomyces sp. NPDC056061 TaxID=3345700 RepID=UPI0035D5AB57
MAEFKVGDTVEHATGGGCVVRFGPYRTRWSSGVYLLEMADGTYFGASGSEIMAPAPAFTVGDVITLSTSGSRATVQYGPYGVNDDIYIVELAEPPDDSDAPREFSALAHVMTKVVDDTPVLVPVGTRVRVDRATYAEDCHGRTGMITSNAETWRAEDDDSHPYIVEFDGGDDSIHVAELTPVDDDTADPYTYDGVTYVPGVDYIDKVGDFWRFDVIDGALFGDFWESRLTITSGAYPIAYAVDTWGPFTRC